MTHTRWLYGPDGCHRYLSCHNKDFSEKDVTIPSDLCHSPDPNDEDKDIMNPGVDLEPVILVLQPSWGKGGKNNGNE